MISSLRTAALRQGQAAIGRPSCLSLCLHSSAPARHLSTSTRAADPLPSLRRMGAAKYVVGGLTAFVALYVAFQPSSLQLEQARLTPYEDQNAFLQLPKRLQTLPTVLPTPVTPLPDGCDKLVLVGLGVREVSMLRVQVYVAGLYVDRAALAKLDEVPGWKGFKADWMLGNGDEHDSEAMMATLLEHGITCAIRINPIRRTASSHFRDSFMRTAKNRIKKLRTQGELDEDSEKSMFYQLELLRQTFMKDVNFLPGDKLDLIFTRQSGTTSVFIEDKNGEMGSVTPNRFTNGRNNVALQIFLAYFANVNEISWQFKEDVARRFEEIMQRLQE